MTLTWVQLRIVSELDSFARLFIVVSRISHLSSWLSRPILVLRKYAETVAAQTCDRVVHMHTLLPC